MPVLPSHQVCLPASHVGTSVLHVLLLENVQRAPSSSERLREQELRANPRVEAGTAAPRQGPVDRFSRAAHSARLPGPRHPELAQGTRSHQRGMALASHNVAYW